MYIETRGSAEDREEERKTQTVAKETYIYLSVYI